MKQNKGFTLIELLVVIAIIAVLAGLILVRIGSASKDARNSRRSADMNQIRTAIEQYRANGGTVSDLAVGDISVSRAENGTTGCFRANDSKGNTPVDYLTGGTEYPKDPQDSAKFYQITCTGGQYTLSRNTTVGDAPTATEVPDVRS